MINVTINKDHYLNVTKEFVETKGGSDPDSVQALMLGFLRKEGGSITIDPEIDPEALIGFFSTIAKLLEETTARITMIEVLSKITGQECKCDKCEEKRGNSE